MDTLYYQKNVCLSLMDTYIQSSYETEMLRNEFGWRRVIFKKKKKSTLTNMTTWERCTIFILKSFCVVSIERSVRTKNSDNCSVMCVVSTLFGIDQITFKVRENCKIKKKKWLRKCVREAECHRRWEWATLIHWLLS